jgi:hypothetical protein
LALIATSQLLAGVTRNSRALHNQLIKEYARKWFSSVNLLRNGHIAL